MCDRPAKGGDKLVSTSFHDTPTRGFAAADDRSVAVCLLPGTELSFEKEIRCEGVIFSWGEDMTFALRRLKAHTGPPSHHGARRVPTVPSI